MKDNKTNPNSDLKTFDEHAKGSNLSEATEINDADITISSDATDEEAFEQALMQNIGMALTEPELAPPGVYPVVRFPRTGDCAWKIDFHKGVDDWGFTYQVSPWVKDMFFNEVEESHTNHLNILCIQRRLERNTQAKRLVFHLG